MNTVTNGLAKCIYNRHTASVEVDYNGLGDTENYFEALNMAYSLAINKNVNRWLFRKTSFEDINPEQFLRLVKIVFFNCFNWSRNGCDKCEVQICVPWETYSKLKDSVKRNDYKAAGTDNIVITFACDSE